MYLSDFALLWAVEKLYLTETNSAGNTEIYICKRKQLFYNDRNVISVLYTQSIIVIPNTEFQIVNNDYKLQPLFSAAITEL